MPELVAEITMQPVRRYDVDAAILYSDIVVPLNWAGVDVDIVPGTGPVVANPIRTMADVAAIPTLTTDQLAPLGEAIGLLVQELGPKPLIGFAGAPFTLASYMIEGGPSKNHENTKAMMMGAPDVWAALLEKLAQMTGTFLSYQIQAGASAVQLFDSWVGALCLNDYTKNVQPFSQAVFDHVNSTPLGAATPKIHFGVGTGELLTAMGSIGADVVGIDYRLDLREGSRRVGPTKAVQGNLDPAVLFAPDEVIVRRTQEIVRAGQETPGHIFNLGHGVLPNVNPAALELVVSTIRES